jgi:hypothetical protein
MAIEGLLALVLVAWWRPELGRTRDLARFEEPAP